MKTNMNISNNLLAKVVATLMVVMVLLSAIAPTIASAHSAYFLSTTVNVGDSRYEPIILFDRDGMLKTHSSHREAKIAYFQAFKYDGTDLPKMDGADAESVEKSLKKLKGPDYVKGGTFSNPFLIYTFPGGHNGGEHQASSQDLARAEWVSRTMVQSLNDAIGFIVQEAGKKPDKFELMYIGTEMANAAYKGKGNLTFNKKKFTFKRSTEAEIKKEKRSGVNADGYVKITAPNGESRHFVQKVPKGYKSNQPLYNTIPKSLRENYADDVRSLTWKHVVLQANYSYIENETTYDSFESISKPSIPEQYMTEMGENFMLSLRSVLGLYTFGQLMLNEGERGGSGYYFGIMPTSWMNSAAILHWTSMALAWTLMFIAFARLLALRNLSAINISKRVDLMDGVKSLIVVGFALMLFNPIFYALANFNFLLVDIMKNTSGVTSQFGSSSPSVNSIARILINLAYLLVEIYFNFIYIARGIIVAILYGTGPLFIASLAFGGKYAQIFSNYMKELVGNIYTQSFHALLVAFFASISVFGGLRMFEQLVVLFAFIPMTKFFRDATGIGGGLMDVAGAGAFGAVSSLTQAGTKGFRSNQGKWRSRYKASKASNGGGGNGGGGGGTPNATQMKNASNFQGAGGGVNNSMAQNDNKLSTGGGSSTAGRQTMGGGASGTSDVPGSATSRASLPNGNLVGSKGGSSMVDNDNAGVSGGKSDGNSMLKDSAKLGASAGFGFGAVAGAVGMAAVEQGNVGQNLNAVAKRPQRNMKSTRPNQKDTKPPKAPEKMKENSSYLDSERLEGESGVVIKNNFARKDANGVDQMYDDYGITDVSMQTTADGGEQMAYTYDFDLDSGTMNSGRFNADNEAMLVDMHSAFNGADNEANKQAREHYQKQGIQGVSYDKKSGLTITAKKGTGGIQEVGSTNNTYSFHTKRGEEDNGKVNLLDAIHYGENPAPKNKPRR